MTDKYRMEEMLSIADELSEKIGEARRLWESLEDMGYNDYQIRQDLFPEYSGGLSSEIYKLPEKLEEMFEEMRRLSNMKCPYHNVKLDNFGECDECEKMIVGYGKMRALDEFGKNHGEKVQGGKDISYNDSKKD